MVQGQSKRGEIKLVWTLSEGRYWVHRRRNIGKAGGAGLVGERRRQRGLWMRGHAGGWRDRRRCRQRCRRLEEMETDDLL